jgi:hypothetical protein
MTDTLQDTLTNGDVTKAEANCLTGKGWAVYEDDTYTVGSPLVIASARTKLTNDGAKAGTNKDFLPDGVADFWDTTLNKILAQTIGDALDIRIQFKAKCSTVSAYFDFEIDIGGSLNVITARTLSSSKGANNEQRYSVGLPLFTLATFVANGGTIYLNSIDDGTTVSVYDIQIFIKRDYAA